MAARLDNAKRTLVPRLRFPAFRDGDGWSTDKLSDVAHFVNDRVPVGELGVKDYVSTENILPDFGGLTTASKLPPTGSVTRVRAHDILVSNIRPYLKKVWASDRDGGASNDVIVIRPKDALSEAFFPFVLKNESFIDYVMTGAKGVKMPRGDVGMMKDYPVSHPSPAEQQKIADCLTSLDELIEAQGRKVEALKAHKKGLMQQLFPREGETVPRLRFVEFEDGRDWNETTVGEMGDVITGSTPETSQRQYYGGLFLFVSPADISELRFVKSTKTTLTEDGCRQTRRVKAGSVMFVCIGSTIGKVAQATRECATNQQINSVVAKTAFSEDFIYYLLVLESERIAALAGKQAVPIVNKSLFSSVKVLAPELAEQKRLSACLGSLDEIIAAERENLAALKAHKKGLMQQLFPVPAGD